MLTSCASNKKKKKAFIAGWLEGSIVHYRFEMYPDATFLLDNGLNTDNGIWLNQKDTFLLFLKNGSESILVAQIINLEAESFLPKFSVLKKMNLKSFSPPKVIKYPNI